MDYLSVKPGKVFIVKKMESGDISFEEIKPKEEIKPTDIFKSCQKCCCLAHCQIQSHSGSIWKKALEVSNPFDEECSIEANNFIHEDSEIEDQESSSDASVSSSVLLQSNQDLEDIWNSEAFVI